MSLVGKKAPLFSARAVINGEEIVDNFSLEQYIGNKEVIFFFFTKDFSAVCPTELLSFQDKLEEFEKRDTVVVGCSCDTEEVHLAWLNTPKNQGGIQGVTFPIIADVSKTVAANFEKLAGDWNYSEEGQLLFEGTPLALRGTVFIDKEGIVRHESVNFFSIGRNINEYIRIVDAWHLILKEGVVCPSNWKEGDDAMKDSRDGIIEYFARH